METNCHFPGRSISCRETSLANLGNDLIFATALNSFRTKSLIHAVTIAITLVGWLVLSNHCALGNALQKASVKAAHDCCHNGSSEPAKNPVDGGQTLQCCKSLHAVVPDTGKFGQSQMPLLPAELEWVEILILEKKEEVLVLCFATGSPPRSATFSELVLHRSLRSHAPPCPA
jgi:hypothetical protein